MRGMYRSLIAVMVAAHGACAMAEGGTTPLAVPVTDVEQGQAEALPEDVATFIERREACDHFRGEPPFDEEREAFLLRMMKETCTGTDAELARLRRVHAGNAAVIEALAHFEDSIEYTGEDG